MSKRSRKTQILPVESSRPFPDRAWIALAIVLLFVVAVRIRLLDMPLERDGGEYAYMGQLILQGVPPYKWHDEAKDYKPETPRQVLVLERKKVASDAVGDARSR